MIHIKWNFFFMNIRSKAGESRMLSANIIRWHFEECHGFYCVCFSVCLSCVVANADCTLRAVIFYCELGVCSLVCLSCVIANYFLRATEKPVLSGHSKNRQNKDLNDKWKLNEGQKYC